LGQPSYDQIQCTLSRYRRRFNLKSPAHLTVVLVIRPDMVVVGGGIVVVVDLDPKHVKPTAQRRPEWQMHLIDFWLIVRHKDRLEWDSLQRVKVGVVFCATRGTVKPVRLGIMQGKVRWRCTVWTTTYTYSLSF